MAKKLQKKNIKKVGKFVVLIATPDKEDLLKAIGNSQREIALQDNPHGYTAVTKAAKNKKKYNRKDIPKVDLW